MRAPLSIPCQSNIHKTFSITDTQGCIEDWQASTALDEMSEAIMECFPSAVRVYNIHEDHITMRDLRPAGALARAFS